MMSRSISSRKPEHVDADVTVDGKECARYGLLSGTIKRSSEVDISLKSLSTKVASLVK